MLTLRIIYDWPHEIGSNRRAKQTADNLIEDKQYRSDPRAGQGTSHLATLRVAVNSLEDKPYSPNELIGKLEITFINSRNGGRNC